MKRRKGEREGEAQWFLLDILNIEPFDDFGQTSFSLTNQAKLTEVDKPLLLKCCT